MSFYINKVENRKQKNWQIKTIAFNSVYLGYNHYLLYLKVNTTYSPEETKHNLNHKQQSVKLSCHFKIFALKTSYYVVT